MARGERRHADGPERGFRSVGWWRAVRLDAVLALVVVVVALAGAWWVSYLAGGSKTVYPHLFYVPIVIAAIRFSWTGAVATALAGGILAGPALPEDVAASLAQPVTSWLVRLAMFLAIGLVVAVAVRGRASPIRSALSDTIVSSQMLQAIRRGEIEPHFQPIYHSVTRTVVGVEALARWKHPRRGWMGPDTFIPAAERTGAVVALDLHMLASAARTVRAWSTDGHPVRLSVNVSAVRFAKGGLVDDVIRALEGSGLPPAQLQLEITESAFVANPAEAARQLADIRRLGVRVAIDDFSAGQSSLLYLTRFPIDVVKLDRSLIGEVTTDARVARLVAGVIVMLRSLSLETVAEGVETADQHAYLDSVDCQYLQGYYIGRPAPAAQIEQLIARSREADILAR